MTHRLFPLLPLKRVERILILHIHDNVLSASPFMNIHKVVYQPPLTQHAADTHTRVQSMRVKCLLQIMHIYKRAGT